MPTALMEYSSGGEPIKSQSLYPVKRTVARFTYGTGEKK